MTHPRPPALLPRRSVLLAAGAGALGGYSAHAAAPLVVGMIYVGARDDYGYNQSHAEAAVQLRAMPGVQVTEEERVTETDDVSHTMESMIRLDGASLLFPTSFGYFNPYMLRAARAYPQVQFRNCGGLWTGSDPRNAGSYFATIGSAQYLCGIVAGHMTRSRRLGFVAAKPIPLVLRNINSFTLGARAVDPAITTQVIFTGDWSMPVREAEATNGLADQGIDIVTCHVDAPKVVVQTAAQRGLMVCGFHANQAALAPQAYLTGAEWNWATIYRQFAQDALAGRALPNFVRGGMAEGFVRLSPYGPAVAAAARQHAEAVRAAMMRGDYSVFHGPLNDNAGRQVIAPGTAYAESAIQLESMDYLVEGVRGSAG